METLKTIMYNKLKTALDLDVYDNRPIPASDYPFADYALSVPIRSNNPAIYRLTVNLWDRNDYFNSTTIEKLVSKIIDEFEDGKVTEGNLKATSRIVSLTPIEDEDSRVQRREFLIELRVYCMERI